MNIEFIVRTMEPLELTCLERDPKLNFVMDRTNLRSLL